MVELRWITVEKHRPGALLAIGPYGGESWQVLQVREWRDYEERIKWNHMIEGEWTEWTDVSLFPENEAGV